MNKEYSKMTAAEMLAYMRTEVFKNIDIDKVSTMNKDERREFMLDQAELLIGVDNNGDYAKRLAFSFFDEYITPVSDNPLLLEPHEGVIGWIVDLMQLLAHLLTEEVYSAPFDLSVIIEDYKPIDGGYKEQFTYDNEQLKDWFANSKPRTRVETRIERMIYDNTMQKFGKIDSAIYDYMVSMASGYEKLGDKDECNRYMFYMSIADDVAKDHIQKGYNEGLSIEEIGLVDSMWAFVPHDYNADYVEAAKLIWQRIKPIRNRLDSGKKSSNDCDLFTDDMLKIITSVAEEFDIDLELDDKYSMPLGYLKDWLFNIYYGDEPILG